MMMPYGGSQSSRTSGSSRGSVGGFQSQQSTESVYGNEMWIPEEFQNPQAVLLLVGRNGRRAGSQGHGPRPQPPRFENRQSPNAHGPSCQHVYQSNCTNHVYYVNGEEVYHMSQQHTPESGGFVGNAFGRGFGNAFGGAAFRNLAPAPGPAPPAFGGNPAYNPQRGQNYFPQRYGNPGNVFLPQRGFDQQPQQDFFNGGGHGPFSQPQQNPNLQELPQDDLFDPFYQDGGDNNGANNNGWSQNHYNY